MLGRCDNYDVRSFIGIHGWTRDPLVEYYIVDNWCSYNRPGSNEKVSISGKNHGDFTIDGAVYTVYSNVVENGSSIDGSDTKFTQIFSIREQKRECGTIDITAHFKKWEELGIQLGNLHDIKFTSEGHGSGIVDFPYAKIRVNPKRKCIIWKD